MVVDLIGIYGLKGPYCTLTTTDWFLQALSVIPRGSWGDVTRRFTMISWAAEKSPHIDRPAPPHAAAPRRASSHALAERLSRERRPKIARPSRIIGDASRAWTSAAARLVAHLVERAVRVAAGWLVVCASRCAHWPTACHSIAPPCCSSCALVAHASRRWAMLGAAAASTGRTLDAWWPMVARNLRMALRRARRGVARVAAVNFRGGGAAGRPPLQQVSGDVVTAGLNSSRVWFGPVPCSP
ncbi:DNA-directed RNA polymerase V subunit 1 [Dorcoceras hygrometricum]|uniref:DNA-directed RNA polymerase V subunit 1 n=1 Tax=Dorcoceras hygrometricum TaxID=472368 RepID=A0A2Z7ABV8_9LAMI|nr:DNA-directed RNA polymerase V subunit 1 [Dorcoceras hygrometricum]